MASSLVGSRSAVWDEITRWDREAKKKGRTKWQQVQWSVCGSRVTITRSIDRVSNYHVDPSPPNALYGSFWDVINVPEMLSSLSVAAMPITETKKKNRKRKIRSLCDSWERTTYELHLINNLIIFIFPCFENLFRLLLSFIVIWL
jgi:hypothetical protein